MAKKTALKALGFTTINSDDMFELMMKKAGLDFKMPDSEKDQRDAVRAAAKASTELKQNLAIQGRLGLVIDGTGKDYNKITKMRGQLATKGYDSAMVFVNTDLETALARNAKRKRSVPEKIATELWKEVQQNLGKFQQAFGDNFYILDNSEGADVNSQTNTVFKKLTKWVKEPPKNGVAKKWIAQQKNLSEKYNPDLEISPKQLSDLEKFGDRLLQKFGLDIEFTKHFGDRMADDRNNPPIKISELQALFKKIAKDKGRKVIPHKDHEAVLKDLQSDLNLPFVLKPKSNDELEVVLKTIMRKKNFKSPDPEVRYEDLNIPDIVTEAVYAGNIGMMELIKFYQKSTEAEKKKLKDLIQKKKDKEAWDMVQKKLGVKLMGKEFNEEVIGEVSMDTLNRYTSAANKDYDKAHSSGNYKKAFKRSMGLMKATGKKIKKDTENIHKALNREEVAGNSIAQGGVDMNPTGRSNLKSPLDKLFRRMEKNKTGEKMTDGRYKKETVLKRFKGWMGD
jgi:predicted kinase